MNVPGYLDVNVRAAMLAQQARGEAVESPVAHLADAPIEELTKDGYFFAGSPDTVLEQLTRFYEAVDGFGNFLMMVQGGTMSYDLTARSMELYATEVLPRFREQVYEPDQRRRAATVGGDLAPVEAPLSQPDALRLP